MKKGETWAEIREKMKPAKGSTFLQEVEEFFKRRWKRS